MSEISRRDVLKAGLLLPVTGVVPFRSALAICTRQSDNDPPHGYELRCWHRKLHRVMWSIDAVMAGRSMTVVMWCDDHQKWSHLIHCGNIELSSRYHRMFNRISKPAEHPKNMPPHLKHCRMLAGGGPLDPQKGQIKIAGMPIDWYAIALARDIVDWDVMCDLIAEFNPNPGPLPWEISLPHFYTHEFP